MLKKNKIVFLLIFIIFSRSDYKNYAINNLILNHSVSINNYLNFTLAFNYGAAFSFLSDAGGCKDGFL